MHQLRHSHRIGSIVVSEAMHVMHKSYLVELSKNQHIIVVQIDLVARPDDRS